MSVPRYKKVYDRVEDMYAVLDNEVVEVYTNKEKPGLFTGWNFGRKEITTKLVDKDWVVKNYPETFV